MAAISSAASASAASTPAAPFPSAGGSGARATGALPALRFPFPSSTAVHPTAANVEAVPFAHASLDADPDGFWCVRDAIPAGTCVLREIPSSVVRFTHGAAVGKSSGTLCMGGADSGAIVAAPALSRLRESCAPNTCLASPLVWNPSTRCILTLVTIADVRAGESLLFSHADLLQEPARRVALVERAGVCCGSFAAADARMRELDAALTAKIKSSSSDESTDALEWTEFVEASKRAGGAKRALELAESYIGGSGGFSSGATNESSHWRAIEARTRATCAAMSLRNWPCAWGHVRELTRGVVATGVPLAHSDAQRLTFELVCNIVRAWQVDDPKAALEAAGATLLKADEGAWLREVIAASEMTARYVATMFVA